GFVMSPTVLMNVFSWPSVIRSGAHATLWSELIQLRKPEPSGVTKTAAVVWSDVRLPLAGLTTACSVHCPSKSDALQTTWPVPPVQVMFHGVPAATETTAA